MFLIGLYYSPVVNIPLHLPQSFPYSTFISSLFFPTRLRAWEWGAIIIINKMNIELYVERVYLKFWKFRKKMYEFSVFINAPSYKFLNNYWKF